LNLDLFKEIFDNFVEPVYIVDPENYQILYVNKVLKEKLGDCVGRKMLSGFFRISLLLVLFVPTNIFIEIPKNLISGFIGI
jgi:hypothetical protein